MIPLDDFLREEGLRIDRALDEAASAGLAGVPEALRAPMRYALGTRGKRLRPLLCRAAFRVVRPVPEENETALDRLAAAVEVVHTYSLVHDDLPCMDDDDLRRGRPTVHRVYGARLAALAGAALLPLAVRLLDDGAGDLGADGDTRSRLVRELCRAAGAAGMVGGQVLDLEGEAAPVDAAGLEAIHRAKTGALLAASLRIGALAAGADGQRLRAFTEYGEALGLAFQIADDVLDVAGSSEALGKTAGRDQSLGKATYPSLFGPEGARALARERAREAVGALRSAGIRAPHLEALALYVVERER